MPFFSLMFIPIFTPMFTFMVLPIFTIMFTTYFKPMFTPLVTPSLLQSLNQGVFTFYVRNKVYTHLYTNVYTHVNKFTLCLHLVLVMYIIITFKNFRVLSLPKELQYHLSFWVWLVSTHNLIQSIPNNYEGLSRALYKCTAVQPVNFVLLHNFRVFKLVITRKARTGFTV